jgi:Zn-dependent protease with chaperone function
LTVAVALIAYALAVGTLGSAVLGRARWTERAPMLGIVTYLAAAWSVLAALGLAGVTLAIHATALGGGLSSLLGACVLRLRQEYATPGGATVAGLGLTLAGLVLARTVVLAIWHLRAVRQHAVQHAQTARLIGRNEPGLGAVLVDHAQPSSYCVAGPHPTVVLTTGALRALNPAQLQAVLAHERAHLRYRHHRLLALARIGHQVLPFVPLMRQADAQVTRLVEMHADDAATGARDTRPLATALVVLATSVTPVPTPAPGLAAAATDAVRRVTRLLRPAEPLGPVRRLALRTGAAALALTPVLLALTPALIALVLGRVPGA